VVMCITHRIKENNDVLHRASFYIHKFMKVREKQ